MVSITTDGWSLNQWFGLVTLVVWLAILLMALLFMKE